MKFWDKVLCFFKKALEETKKLLVVLGELIKKFAIKAVDLFKKFIDLVKRNNIAKIGVAVGLAGIITLTCCLAFCGDNKGGGSGSGSPLEGYQVLDTLNGKTAEQIYAEIVALTSQDNFSYNTKYTINCTTTIPQIGPYTSRLWHEVSVKKAGNDIYREVANTDQKGTFLEKEGRHLTENTFVNGENYFYKARVLNTENKHEINVKARTKTEMTYEQLLESMGITESELLNPFYDFKTEDFNGVKFYSNKNNSEDVYFILTLKGAPAKEFARVLLCKTLDGEVFPDNSNDVTYTVLLTKDGKFEKVEVSFRTQISDQRITSIFNSKGEISLFDIGSTTVSIPANADKFNNL